MKTSFAVTLCAALGCGLMAGLFFAFSVCVMKALAQLPPKEGIATMRNINVAIQNPLFFSVFFGAAALCFYELIAALKYRGAPDTKFLIIGSACYLIGALLVTILFNVPLNDALAAAKPDESGARLWANYLTNWTLWNHVRTVACLAATVAFSLALRQPPQP